MRRKRSDREATATENAAVGVSGREFLEPFALLVVALIVVALAIVSLVVAQSLQRQARAAASEAAPTTMNLMTEVVRQNLRGPSHRLRQLANDLARTLRVRSVRIACPARPADGQSSSTDTGNADANAALVFAADSPVESGEVLQTLRADIRADDGVLLGTLEVGFGTPALPAIPLMLWTTSGLVAVATLAAFWLVYRAAQRRMRPLGYVRDSLLSYHDGSEKSLELLAVHDYSDGITQAWNSLIRFVNELQHELDSHRCRETVVDSMHLLQSQSAQAILDALPVGVLRIDGAQRLIYANYSATRMLGIRDEATSGPALTERLGEERLAETILALPQSIGGAARDYRFDGGSARTIVRLTPIDVATDTDDEQVVMAQDVSQLKEAERSREEFLAHITHELRTPLTNIRAYTETLNEDFFDDEQTRRECYNVIMSESRRLTKLIEDVLSASQIDAGVARFERVPVRVDESLRQVVQDVQAAADAKSLELALRIPSKLPTVVGDPQRLHQVWTNLIGNAVKYTPEGGSLGVDVQADGAVLRVRVTDSGIGIPPEFHEKVFEKFFRVSDPAVAAEVGSGLGLAISREIVRAHGGTIHVESQPAAGATFIVELPLTPSRAGAATTEVTNGAHRHR